MTTLRTLLFSTSLILPVAAVLTLLAVLAGCVVPPQPGMARSGQGDLEPGPFPVRFRDMVMEHIFETYPGDQVLRNIVVHPPLFGVAQVGDKELAGYTGQARFRLKDLEKQAYVPVVYCYFISKEKVVFFEDEREADWCIEARED